MRRVLVDDMNSCLQAVLEEVRFHKSNLDQYRDRINRIESMSIDNFKADQSSYYSKQLREFESYLKLVDDTYKDVKRTIKIQQQAINELNRKYMRSDRIDESLEAFKLFYNETSSSYLTFAKNPLLVLSTMRVTDMFHRQKDADDPWSMQIESLYKKLQQNWQLLTDEGPRSFEALIENTLQNITRFQDDVFRQVYVVRNFSQVLLPSASTKQDLRSARTLFETQLQRFETDRRVWIEDKKRLLDTSLQALNSKIAVRDSIYGELLDKRTEAIRYNAISDQTLSKVLQLIDAYAAGVWKLTKSVDGIEVYRLMKEQSSAEGSYACVSAGRHLPHEGVQLVLRSREGRRSGGCQHEDRLGVLHLIVSLQTPRLLYGSQRPTTQGRHHSHTQYGHQSPVGATKSQVHSRSSEARRAYHPTGAREAPLVPTHDDQSNGPWRLRPCRDYQ